MLKKIGLVLCIIVAIAAIAIYFLKSGRQSKTAAIDLQYDFVSAARVDMSEKVDATGSVVSVQGTEIYPAYNATVARIMVKNGDPIRKGQLLMVLDSPTLATTWAQDESALRQAVSNLSLAESQLSRIKTLFAAQGETRDNLEAAQNKYDLALDQLNLARFNLNQLLVNPDHANYVAANHRSLNVCAPIAGTVASLNVRPGDAAATQTSLISVIPDDSLKVEANVDETDIKDVRPGQPAQVTLNDTAQTVLNGIVSDILSVGKNDNGVIEYPVRIKVNPGETDLKTQMTADITIVTNQHPNALAVPNNAVVQRRGHSMVALRDGNQVMYTRVTTGLTNDIYTEILDGLKEGDTVAIKKANPGPSQGNGNNNNGNAAGRNSSGNNRDNNRTRRMMPF